MTTKQEALLAWLRQADQEANNSKTPIDEFLHQRYDVMSKAFPHEVFSVQEATPEFFCANSHI